MIESVIYEVSKLVGFEFFFKSYLTIWAITVIIFLFKCGNWSNSSPKILAPKLSGKSLEDESDSKSDRVTSSSDYEESNSSTSASSISSNNDILAIEEMKKNKNFFPNTFEDLDKSIFLQEKYHISIFYSSITQTSEKFSTELYQELLNLENILKVNIYSIASVPDWEEYLVDPPTDSYYIFVVSSYEKIHSPAKEFISILDDIKNDFRIDKTPLSNLMGVSVIGFGNKEQYPRKKFCFQAIKIAKSLKSLGAKLAPTAKIDMYDARSRNAWKLALMDLLSTRKIELCELIASNNAELLSKEIRQELKIANTKMIRSYDDNNDDNDDDDDDDDENIDGNGIDLEDIGEFVSRELGNRTSSVVEMVPTNSKTFAALTKQGYTIVGSHSGVKICRWTKSSLRGRGSCYKFSFYGIKSHLCMETTPSLACSNKCTFCWRHGTNPVGTKWRWVVDDPNLILEGALRGHYQKIKQLRGAPGLRDDRFQEASQVKHCALSLVGEPIFYPYINEFVALLHSRNISSFLVNNAQHPEALKNLCKVTQLYVSLDASTKESLRKVDRPLFRDFWDRLLRCLDILANSRQRTVLRLTLVKSMNMTEIDDYCKLIRRGKPSFIEVKGVTFCGTTDNSDMTMKDVPYHEEVVDFCRKLVKGLESMNESCGPEYDICSEHAHSNCVLIAQKAFFKGRKWHSHIDYDKFFKLLKEGQEFGPLDYTAPTPEFALFGNGGFSPDDHRFYRKKKSHNIVISN